MNQEHRQPEIRNRFDRYECKYLITEEQAARLRRYLAPFLCPDPFAEHRDGRYRICSLYLDTPDLRLHRETVEGQRTRFKLRIRCYSDASDDPVFFEIKRRSNRVISKTRLPVSRALMRSVLLGGDGAVDLAGAARGHYEEFVGWLRHLGAVPVVLVRYEREAWMGRFDREARVTYDRRVECRTTDRPEVTFGGPGWASVEGRRIVLELKFNGRCPRWMTDAIERFELHRVSFSKYSKSVVCATNVNVITTWHRSAAE